MKRLGMLALAAGVVLAAPGIARAQEVALKSAFSGESMPLAKKLKELDGGWRRITIGGNPSESKGSLGGFAGGMLGMMFGGGGNAGGLSAPPSYYTMGNTITVGQEIFLVTYRHQTKGIDFGELVAQAGQGGPPKFPDPDKLTADSELQLTLLNVRSVQMISGIRPFNLDRELADAQKEFEREIALRKQMEGGPFGGPGAAVAVPDEPEVGDGPAAAPKAPPKKAVAPKKPAPKKK